MPLILLAAFRRKHRLRRGASLQVIDQRFEAFPDPCDNWIVWDNDEDNFAEIGSHHLTSLSESQARLFCYLLNLLLPRINRDQQNAQPVPSAKR
jgi:hypothetical protein